MAVDVNKITMGPCKLTFDFEGDEPVIFEQTQGGVVLTYEETTRDVNVDQLGTNAADVLITGRAARVEAPIVEHDLDKLAVLIPGSKLVVDATDPLKKRLDVSARKVERLFKYARSLKIEPLDESATTDEIVVLHKAAAQTNLNYTYTNDNERVINATFRGFEDAVKGLISFGDPDVVPAP